jgi:hypothetical protein
MTFTWVLIVTAVWWAACIAAYVLWARHQLRRSAEAVPGRTS